MGKVFVVLDEKEQLEVERICLDKKPEDALRFVLKSVAPKIHKRVPCMDKATEIYRPQM